MKAKNSHKPQNSPEQELQRGVYTPNQCIFFTVIALAAMIPFLGQRMSHLTQEINNHSLKNIYAALSAPVESVTEAAPTAAVIPILRNAFIHTAGLQNRSEWDTFFTGKMRITAMFQHFTHYPANRNKWEVSTAFPTISAAAAVCRKSCLERFLNKRSVMSPCRLYIQRNLPCGCFSLATPRCTALLPV